MGSKVISPIHYIGLHGVEVEIVLENFIPYYEDAYVGHRIASSVEYLLRAPNKNGLEDIEKAIYNAQQAVDYIKRNGIDIKRGGGRG